MPHSTSMESSADTEGKRARLEALRNGQPRFFRAGEGKGRGKTGSKDLVVPGAGTLRSVGNMIPSLQPLLPLSGIYNIALKRDTPLDILDKISPAFVDAVKSDAFQAIAKKKFFDVDIRSGADADRRAAQVESVTAQTFWNAQKQIGKKVKSPDQLGLPDPADFDKWWPPQGYTSRMK